MKKIKDFLTIISLIFIIGSIGIWWWQNKKENTPETERRLDSMFILDTSKGEYSVVVTKDEIWLNEFTNITNEMGHFTVKKSDYPELFKQGVANSSFISVVSSEDKSKIIISNNQPDHGSYSSAYKLIFDPITKKIIQIPSTKTEIIEYKQTYIPKNSKKGRCWNPSIASSGSNAWRCMTDEFIHDPCFETDSGQVVCGIDSEKEEDAFELKLTEPLPKQRNDNTRESSYWKIELENGFNCYVFTGTAGNLNNEYVYHYCSSNAYLLSGIKIGEEPGDKTFNKDSKYWKVRMVVDVDDKGYSQTLPVEEVNVIRVWK